MADRRAGFYWVRVHSACRVLIAEWSPSANVWYVPGSSGHVKDRDVRVLSECLEPSYYREPGYYWVKYKGATGVAWCDKDESGLWSVNAFDTRWLLLDHEFEFLSDRPLGIIGSPE